MGRRNLIKKILLLGDGAVGKTSLIRKFVYDEFDDKYLATIGAKVTKKVLEFEVEGEHYKVTMMIHDIVGQVEFEKIHRQYYRGAEAVLLVFDLTRRETFDHIGWWLESLSGVVGRMPAVLIGNKVDLGSQHQVSLAEITEMSRRLNCQYLLTSAKTGENVESSFDAIGRRVCSK
jgi:small GTP-binding protein